MPVWEQLKDSPGRPRARWRRFARPSWKGARLLGIVNVVGSSISREAVAEKNVRIGKEVMCI